MHVPDQFADLRLALDNLENGFLVSQGVILELLKCHYWVLPPKLRR